MDYLSSLNAHNHKTFINDFGKVDKETTKYNQPEKDDNNFHLATMEDLLTLGYIQISEEPIATLPEVEERYIPKELLEITHILGESWEEPEPIKA